MNQSPEPYMSAQDFFAADAAADERASFVRKTYIHLAGAVGMFVLLEYALLQAPFTERLVGTMLGGQYSWLIVLGLFMGVSWIADSWARSATSLTTQYMGLGLYVLAQSIITLPLVYLALMHKPDVVPMAAITTLGLFAALTCVVIISRQDFSFMRGILMFGGIAAFGLIACGIFFNFQLGPIFTYAMIAFACGYILYDTSNVMHHYRTDQYVAASLALFASVALLFWYVLQLFMSRD